MEPSKIKDQVREFIQENFLYMRTDFQLTDDASLMEQGVLDSMGVLEVTEFINEQFGVRVPDEDMTVENLGCLNAIGAYVAKRLEATSQAATENSP